MPEFTQVPTEYAYGVYAGADYGSKIRILMRSETMVMFVGYGLNLSPRNERNHHNGTKIANSSKASNLTTPSVRQKIIAAFGEGADEAAICAIKTRGRGTILVDGGGEKLPLPRVEASKLHYERYAAATPTTTGLIPVERKCRQCGKDLVPSTDHHRFSNVPTDGQPKTVEECARYTNVPIFSVTGYSANSPEEWWPFVDWFATWDGESYLDPDFCNDRCASIYGRRAARDLPPLETGVPAIPHPYRMREDVDHYEKEPDRFTESGLRY